MNVPILDKQSHFFRDFVLLLVLDRLHGRYAMLHSSFIAYIDHDICMQV